MNTHAPLVIGEITVKRPLLQGGMGIGISLGGLAGAVAKEGGIGVISAAQIGFREPDFDADPVAANVRALHKEMQKAREAAPDGIIGFNIMVAMQHYELYVKEAVKAGADLIISGAGLPTELPKFAAEAQNEAQAEAQTGAQIQAQTKEPRRIPVKLAPIVSTDKSARVILKYWDKKYRQIPDLLVIEGPKAGGHLGFTREQLAQFDDETYCQEVRKILETVKEYEEKYGTKIPTALAGGIESREAAERAFALGVDAVQAASRFVTTEECDADIRYKEAYINAREEDIMIVKSPVGMPGRAIRNSFMDRVEAGEKILHGCHSCLHKCKPAEIPYCITDALIHAAKGETDDALLFCGEYAWKAQKIETVKEVIDSLLGNRI